jgi:thaumarchaeosortase
MQNVFRNIKQEPRKLLPLLPLLAFIVPMVLLYVLNPVEPPSGIAPSVFNARDSFESMWKGRTFQLFFVWLISLELILSWESFKANKLTKSISARTILFAVMMVLPTVYVLASYYLGLNDAIINLSTNQSIKWASSMPLAIEYLVFAALFCGLAFLLFGKKGLLTFSIPAVFMVIVGALYAIDNIFPYGQFTPFQLLVPTTAFLAAQIFNLMGYTTVLGNEQDLTFGTMPTLAVDGPAGYTKFAIAWPCAGIESLLIFTVVVLLFLKRMPISWKAKIGYFAIGAAVTYFINILRIVTIFMIGMQYGQTSIEVQDFHFYYGPLYSITWIITYPLLIFAIQNMWHRFRNRKPPNSIPTESNPNLPIK